MKKLAGALLTLALAFTGLAVQPASAAVILDANGVALLFDEATSVKIAGTSSANNRGKAAGDIVKYPAAATISGTTIDAVVKTVSVTSAVIDNYDGGSAVSNMDTLFQSDVTTTNAGSVVYEYSFYVTNTYTGVGTGTAVTLRNVYINSYDLDASQNGNNQYTQFTGVQSYTLSNNSTIAVSSSGNMLQFINSATNANYSTSNGSYTKGRVQVKYDYLSTISIKIGTDNAGSGGGNFFALDFSVGLAWTEGSTTISTTSVQNGFNSPPTSANDAITAAASTAQFVTLSDFGSFADPDGNPWVDVKIVTLPTDGTLEFFNGSTWVAVTAGQNVSADAIDASKLRYTANSTATTDSLTFKVGDGLAYSTAAYTLAITVTGGASPSPSPSPSASVSSAQTITYAQPADQVLTAGTKIVAPTADSNLPVTLTSGTTGACTVSGYTITFVTTGTCTTTATQAGDSNYSAATPVSRNFLITAAPAPAPAAPAGPSLSPVAGTTLATTPITLSKPMNSGGSGSACLVDPADSVCKSSVTLPGKGTFTLNSDGTVTFTPVKGFVGEAIVQLRATDKYGQSVEAPVSVVVSPVPGAQVGSTKGVTPIILKPVRASLKSTEICLIDVADQGCKTVVKSANVGTWRQAANGSVSFVAVAGYFGTTTVQQRVTFSGASTFNPYTVTVAKKRGPVTITISGFADGSPVMTEAIKAQVNAFLKAYADYRQVTCIGYTEGPTVLATDAALSRQRALNACGFVKGGLGKSLFMNKVRAGQDTVEASQYRRITITLND